MLELEKDICHVRQFIAHVQRQSGNRTVVYTALTGNHDKLAFVNMKNKGADYICFTDDAGFSAKGWLIVNIEFIYRDPRRLAKFFKVLPHLFFESYDYSFWMDANAIIKKDVVLLVDRYLIAEKNQIAFFPHKKRRCVYEEMSECIRWGKDSRDVISRQVCRYKVFGYPENNGLIVGTFIMRRHNHVDVKRLMEKWWEEIDSFSVRDQLSFNYSAWALSIPFKYIVEESADDYIKLSQHSKLVTYGTSIREKLITLLARMIIKVGFLKRSLKETLGLGE